MSDKKRNKKLSVQLLCVLLPMIAAFIIILAVILFANASSFITDEGIERLKQESTAYAKDIGGTMRQMKGFFD
ncbi:MAG: hypothetical protein IJL07_00230 [Lachnospiraceae bacterium]|nr:hypothetical protein [Lachnospiraceae bacterium]